MAEYVWWFLIVGLVIGGAVVAFFMADVLRRDEDLDATERGAEATLIAGQLAADGRPVDARSVAAVLRAHRDYRRLPPPDRFAVTEPDPAAADDEDDLAGLARPRFASARDGDADREADDVRHSGGAGADEDLPRP